MTSLIEHPYPIRPAAQVDPTGTFERAYLEVAGMSETELSPHREYPLARHAPSSGEAEPVAWRYSPDKGEHWHLSDRFADQGRGWLTEPLYTHPSPSGVNAEVVVAIEAGWNACRKSVYAVCEDVQNEADRLQMSSKPGTASEEQHAKGYYAGSRYAAKSIARGFNSMNAMDDDNLRAALQAQAAASGAGEMEICPDCNGSGEYADWGGTCPLCGGSGASLAPTEPTAGR